MIIEPYMDHVLICGQKVVRPRSIPRSLWMKFWEHVHSASNARLYR